MQNNHSIPKHLFVELAQRMDEVLGDHQNPESHKMILAGLAHGRVWAAYETNGGIFNDFQEKMPK